jgi:hypothetical protein
MDEMDYAISKHIFINPKADFCGEIQQWRASLIAHRPV